MVGGADRPRCEEGHLLHVAWAVGSALAWKGTAMTNRLSSHSLVGTFDTYRSAGLAIATSAFTPVELTVMELAWRESHRSQAFDRSIFKAPRRWFGLKEPLPLADPKLEALRRYAIQLRRSSGVGDRDAGNEMIEVGYTAEQVRAIHLAVTNW